MNALDAPRDHNLSHGKSGHAELEIQSCAAIAGLKGDYERGG